MKQKHDYSSRNINFRFTNIQPSIEGGYTCTAENSAGKVSATTQIIVQSSPTLTIIPSSGVLHVKEGEPIRLECRADGKPAPVVFWNKYEPSEPSGS